MKLHAVKRLGTITAALVLITLYASGDLTGQASRASLAELPLERTSAPPEGAIVLPRPEGPYQVGTRVYHRVLEELEELTADPSDHREILVQLFYPARRTRDDIPPAAYVPELPALRRGLLAHGFPAFAELSQRLTRYAEVQTAAWPGEPVLRDGTFPVVLISPGGNMSRHWYTALAQELASQGFAVAVMSHAHSGIDVFPEAGFLASHRFWHPGSDVPEDEAERRETQLAGRLALDAGAVLDGLALLADGGGSDWSGALDLERVAIIGHSRGGSTVSAACTTDARIGACVILDNLGDVPGIGAGLDQPRLTIHPPWSTARSQRLAAILSQGRGDAFDVVVPGTNHYSFTDLPFVDEEAYPSEGIDPAEAHEIIAWITLAFLNRYLLRREGGFLDAIEPLAGRVEVRPY